jgi:parallel beta-helix repeat protein
MKPRLSCGGLSVSLYLVLWILFCPGLGFGLPQLSIHSKGSGNTIQVPTGVSTIQGGINAANDGDTVLVAPGTYSETLDFLGKNITVASSGGASVTILDAGKAAKAVSFHSGETRSAVLQGFTIQNAVGYGIYISNSNPSILNNIINGNLGYGIFLEIAGALIQGNTISNTATAMQGANYGCDWNDGSGIYFGSGNAGYDLEVINNLIENNYAQCQGGGLQLVGAPSQIIQNNIIRNNVSLGEGGGISVLGGLQTLSQNLIYNNTSGAAGAGIFMVNGSDDYSSGPINSIITNNTIANNMISGNGDLADDWVDGSQIALPGYVSGTGIFNNIIVANDPYFGAIACYSTYEYLSSDPPVVMYNDIINLNSKGSIYSGWCTSPAGDGHNISADPKFVSSGSNYHLGSGSPAIDAGYNAAPGMPADDLDGNARIQNGGGASYAIADMGAYEYSGTPNLRTPTQSSLSASTSSTPYGSPVQFNASTTSLDTVTSGSISLLDDWSAIATTAVDANGNATFTSNSLAVGDHWLIAAYNGSAVDDQSISTTQHVFISGFSTSTSLSLSATSLPVTQALTMTTTVTSGNGTPAGHVNFILTPPNNTTTTVSVPLDATGTATYTTNLPAGNNAVQAIYPLQGGYLTSTSIVDQVTVNKLTTASTMTVTPTTILAGQSMTFNTTVAGPGGTPTGTVAIMEDDINIISATLASGAASISTTYLSAGAHSMTAYYVGDATFAPSTSSPMQVNVQDYSIALTSVALSVTTGQSVSTTLTATPIAGFSGTIIYSCALPAVMTGATCSAAPVTLNGSGTQSTTLVVTTLAASSKERTSRAEHMLSGIAFLLCACLSAPWKWKNRWRGQSFIAILLITSAIIAMSMSSCGGGGSSSTSNPGTPTGNYYATLNSTSNGETHSLNLTINVQ